MMRDTIFKSIEDMSEYQQPFSPMGNAVDPLVVRTAQGLGSMRESLKPALWPNKAQAVHNLEPAKRGRHY
jgi:hypothetical protein